MTPAQAYEVVRFYRVVSPVPGMLKAAIATVAVVGAPVVLQVPSLAGRALAPLLLLHMFAASSGFRGPARRGHYDLLLTRRSARVVIALVHWSASVAPGIAAWLTLGAIELVGRGGDRADLLTSGSWCAMGVVSMLAWATGVAVPRFGGAIGWLVLMVAAGKGLALESEWHLAAPYLPANLASAASFLLDPGATVGVALTPTEWRAITPALVLAVVAMISATLWIVRADVSLEAGQ